MIIPRTGLASDEISVIVDGRFIEFDVSPQLVNDRTMVPLRAIFEALGATVEWDNDTQTVTATKDEVCVVATIGSKTIYVNNVRKTMDVAPIIINGRTLVPVRFVAEALDCNVEWNENTQTVEISSYNADNNKDTVEFNSPRHAPNMYVDWITNNEYDVISVDWYCDEDALNTYWAVHNWENGYAGFQNKDGNHVLLLSLWDLPDGTNPTIEYVLDGTNGNFGGEGTGKQVFTNYNWEVGKWYSMCIQLSSDNNKTYYTQYVREENDDWLKTAVISYPVVGDRFYGSSMFQEDFTFNNLSRSCGLRNACGKIYGTDIWESWDLCKITNSFFPTDDATWEKGVENNIDFNCNWENYSDYVWVQSGGKGFASNGKQIPVQYNLNNSDIPPESLFGKQDSFFNDNYETSKTGEVLGLWTHNEYSDNYNVLMFADNQDTVTVSITAIRGNGAQIAVANVENVIFIDGMASFHIIDSFGNEADCSMKIENGKLTIMYTNEQLAEFANWGVVHVPEGHYIKTAELSDDFNEWIESIKQEIEWSKSEGGY